MRISDWSSDVCSSDLAALRPWRMDRGAGGRSLDLGNRDLCDRDQRREPGAYRRVRIAVRSRRPTLRGNLDARQGAGGPMATLHQGEDVARSEEHKSELPSLMRLPYAVFRVEKKK